MKTALITTTINVPKVLSLYRAHDPDVMFFVAGDLKTPDDTEAFCDSLDNCIYISPEAQKQWKSDAFIGNNTDSKRNSALLAALRWGAELIVSVDDDMIPTDFFFDTFKIPFAALNFTGLQLGSYKRWVDVGEYTIPQARQRGIPPDAIPNHEPRFVTNAKIGAAQGIILGIPDAAATHTIANHPHVHSATDILKNGFVVHPEAWAVMNSQLTAFRAELAPTFAQFYFVQGRNTDIQASVLMRRIMRERNLYSYYGPPMALHARSPRLLFNDLKAEMYGMGIIGEYADYLDRAPVPTDASVVEQCRILAKGWNGPELEAALAFYDDCEVACGNG